MASPAPHHRRLTASSLDDVAPPLSPLGSNPVVLYRRSHTGVGESRRDEKSAPRPESATPFPSVLGNFYAGDLHDTMLLGERLRARRARDDVTALVDFLKNYPPPPDNFMSIPYEDDDDGQGPWSKIKALGRGRSKSMPRLPQPIQLPDSAVAGVTIGGHRHIAISIPLEATPDGDEMRSQYPVFNQERVSMDAPMGVPMIASGKSPVRTFKNKKGVVTVLRPVTEVNVKKSKTAAASGRQSPPHANSRGRKPPPLPPHKPTINVIKQPHDYIGVLPTRFDTPLLDDGVAPWHDPPDPASTKEGLIQSRQSPTFQRTTYPARASSMNASRAGREPPSIDGVISPSQEQMPRIPIVTRGRYFSDSFIHDRFTSDQDARNAIVEADESLAGASSRLATRAATNGSHSTTQRNQDRPHAVTVITESPLLLSHDDETTSPSLTSVSVRSRKALVKERRRRDMEAMLLSKAQAKEPQASVATNVRFRVDKEAVTKSESTLTMSHLMVVMDVRPEPDNEKSSSENSKAVTLANVTTERPRLSLRSMTARESSMPTPPTSPHGSPSQRGSTSDRTSLTRRREWRAMRDQERKAREAMAVAKAKAGQLALSGPKDDNDGVTQADREIMRLCEVYGEHRLRDMERRLRKLERNRDFCLQALVPALNRVAQIMAAAGEEQMDERRDWSSSDGEASETGRDGDGKRTARRLSLSQIRLL